MSLATAPGVQNACTEREREVARREIEVWEDHFDIEQGQLVDLSTHDSKLI